MRIIFCFLCALSLCSFYLQPCELKTEGIYTASVDKDIDAHIRFYTDGTVIVSTSVKEFKDVKSWFNKENMERVLAGKYKNKKGQVKFSVKGDTGEQKFEGFVDCDAARVTITDAKSKASVQRTYKFIPF